jgi:DNA-binding XRE family transcriptional regulator
MATMTETSPVQRIRESLDMTRAELAERVRTTRQHILRIETYQRVPSVHLAQRIAIALGTDVAELFPAKK